MQVEEFWIGEGVIRRNHYKSNDNLSHKKQFYGIIIIMGGEYNDG